MSSLILPAHARAPIRDALADLGQTAEVGPSPALAMVNFEVGVGGLLPHLEKAPGPASEAGARLVLQSVAGCGAGSRAFRAKL